MGVQDGRGAGAGLVAGKADRWLLRPAVYEALRLIGTRLSVSLNHVELDDAGVSKRRRRIAPAALVNLSLDLLGTGVRFLDGAAWIAWERALHAATTGAVVEERGGALWVQRLPGEPLSLALPRMDAAAAGAALRAAFAALGRLHAVTVRWADGVERTVSHADAMSRNVFWDEASRAAAWFDFETQHRPEWPAPARRADDLRALAFSAALHADPAVVAAAVDAYPDREALRALPGMVLGLSPARLLFHMSQAPLPWERFVALRSNLAEAAR